MRGRPGDVPDGQLFWLSLLACGVALIGFSRATSLAPAIAFAGCLGLGAGVLNAVIGPILLSATPAHMLGRVSAVLSPLMQLAEIVSMILAGALASTVLRGVHFAVAGVSFGPYDTVFAVGGLLFLIGGVSAIAPMRRAGRSAAAPAADGATATATATSGGDGPAVAASD